MLIYYFLLKQLCLVIVVAQESSGTQGVLGPTKIFLAVQPPDSAPVEKTNTSTTAHTVSKTIEPAPAPVVPISNNVSESSTQINNSEQVITIFC